IFQKFYFLINRFLIFLIVSETFGVLQTLMNDIMTQKSNYRITRLLGLTQNGMMSVIVWQALIFMCYGVAFGVTFGIFFTKLLWFVIDPASNISVDTTLVIKTISIMLLLTLICFTLQGYQMIRYPLESTKNG